MTDHLGNMILLATRPEGDRQAIQANKVPASTTEVEELWLGPETSDPARRLVNAARIIMRGGQKSTLARTLMMPLSLRRDLFIRPSKYVNGWQLYTITLPN